jgi:lactam utilization protein B
VHGDGPSAVAIVDRVVKVLEELGRPLRPATAPRQEGVSA